MDRLHPGQLELWKPPEAIAWPKGAMMEWDEDEQFLAEWIFDESRSGSSEVTRKLDIDQSSKDEVALTPPEVVRRVYGLGRAVADVFKEFSLHYWTSGGTTLGAVR